MSAKRSELLTARWKMEEEIEKALRAFESTTGLAVKNLVTYKAPMCDGGVAKVRVEVEAP